MERRFKRKFVKDERGVTEIIADILILSMTVTLFMVLFLFVWTLPSPTDVSFAEFQPDLTMDADAQGGWVNITHTSGETLFGGVDGRTKVYLFKNLNEEVIPLDTIGTYQLRDYGILESPDTHWDVGEEWVFHWDTIEADDELEVKILDEILGDVIWQSNLMGLGQNDAPIIMDRSYYPNPAVTDSDITLYISIRDPDGYSDISQVSADVSELNSTLGVITLTDTEEDGIFEGTVKVTSPIRLAPYSVTIYANDGNLSSARRMRVYVTSTSDNSPQILDRWTDPQIGQNNSVMRFFVKVLDPEGRSDLDSVRINVNPLDPSKGWVDMSDPDMDGIFEYMMVINVTNGGSFNISLNATDLKGNYDTAKMNVTIKYFKPVIMEVWTSPVTGVNNSFLNINARVYDPNGYNNIKDVHINISGINISSSGWKNMADPDLDSVYFYRTRVNVLTAGEKTLYFRTEDHDGNTDTAIYNVSMSSMSAPSIENIWTDPVIATNDTNIRILAKVIDGDGYEDINFTGAVTLNMTELNPALGVVNMVDGEWDGIFEYEGLINVTTVGTKTVRVSATDIIGLSDTARMNITVIIPPHDPIIEDRWTAPIIGLNGSEIIIYAQVSDPDGYLDIDTVQVNVTNLNASLGWVTMLDPDMNGIFEYSMMINVTEAGTKTLYFHANDTSGNSDTAVLNVTVISNKPSIIQYWYSPDPAVNGSSVTFFAWVADADGYEDIDWVRVNITHLNASYGWVNMTDTDLNNIYEYTLTEVNVTSSGVHNVTIKVRDQTGNTYSKLMNVTVVESEVVEDEMTEPTIFGMVTPNGVNGGGEVYISALAFNGTSVEDKIVTLTFQLIDGSRLVWPAGSPSSEVEMDRAYENLFRDPDYGTGRTAPYATQYNDVVYVRFRAYNSTTKTSEHRIAQETVTLLVIYDKSGGKVTEGTALEQNVAWISGEQGFVITNNKTSPDPHQIFDTTKAEDEIVWIKIGSNIVTNLEKANIFKLHSRTKDVDVPGYCSPTLQFEYDGVLAGYWFFVLNFSAKNLYDGWMDEKGLESEYFDIYMKIKDSTDDFFSTNSWIVVHGGTLGTYAELKAYFDPSYIPGSSSWDPSNPSIPAGLQEADGGTDYMIEDDHIFNSTERVYLKIDMITPNDDYSDVDANQIEFVDFVGNRPLGNEPGAGPVSIPVRSDPLGEGTEYWLVVDMLRADKDPWVIGESAYTVFIREFHDIDETNLSYLTTNILVQSPSSILDVVSGMPSQASTTRDNYLGFFYENIGIFDKDPYEVIPGGAGDDVEAIFSVAFADLDNDDKKDIIAGTKAGFLYLYQNNGFWTRNTLDEVDGDHCTNVYTADVDSDGDDDVVAGDTAGKVYYYENDGSWGGVPDQTITGSGGGFGAIGSTGKNPAYTAVGDHALSLIDLDGDDDLDLVIGGANGLFYCLFDSTTKQFGSDVQIDTNSVFSVDTGDINQDGYFDIAFAENSGNDVWVILNDGVGAPFDTSTPDLVANNFGSSTSVGIGDLTGSGWLEVVAGGGDLEVYEYSVGTWGLATNQPSGYSSGSHGVITSLVVDNVDGAIEEDIVISTEGDLPGGPGGYIFYFRNMGLGSEYLLMQPYIADLTQDIGTPQEICTITLGDADEGLA